MLWMYANREYKQTPDFPTNGRVQGYTLRNCTFIDCPPPVDNLVTLENPVFKITDKTLVFYAGSLIDPTPAYADIPEGAYVKFPQYADWYLQEYGLVRITNIEDVPKDIRLHARLINGKE